MSIVPVYGDTRCDICLQSKSVRVTRQTKDSKFCILSCGHYMCVNCIDNLLRVRYRICPYCRKSLTWKEWLFLLSNSK